MFKTFSLVSCLMALQYQLVASQYPRQLFFNRPTEIVETPRSFITESPCNVQLPLTSASPSSTTIITDCSPTACKNLANTLQLMIVCNLLQNKQGGSDLALQLASPMINDLFTSPVLSCGCSNPFATNIVSPSVVSPSVVSPNLITGLPNTVSNNSPLFSGLLSGFI